MQDQAETGIPVGMASSVWQVCSADQFIEYLKLDSEKMRLKVVWHILFLAMCIRRNLACEISEVRNHGIRGKWSCIKHFPVCLVSK